MSECKHGAVVWGDCVKCKDKRIANLEAIKERLENLLAEGVHTCIRQSPQEQSNGDN